MSILMSIMTKSNNNKKKLNSIFVKVFEVFFITSKMLLPKIKKSIFRHDLKKSQKFFYLVE